MKPEEPQTQGEEVSKIDDWALEGSGDSSDPSLNVCESCQ